MEAAAQSLPLYFAFGRCETDRNKIFRALSGLLPVWFGSFLVFPIFPAALPTDAEVAKEAWWSLYSAGLPVATPTTVPADALGVGHNTSGPDKLAAVGIALQAPPGSTVQTLTLHMKEAEGTAANIGADTASVTACPITGPWDAVLNGEWSAVPAYDCELATAAGKRSADGTRSFDLRAVGEQWLDAEAPLEQEGILLIIEESAQPAQVSLRSIKTGEFRLEFAASAPTSDAPDEPVEPVVVGELEVPEEVSSIAPPPAGETPVEESAPDVLLAQPTQNRSEEVGEPDILGNLPFGVWLLGPIAVGIAAAISYALRPGGRGRVATRRRAGAVSRALSREAAER